MLETIKKLREMTGLGINDCKKALEAAKGNIDKAIVVLKEKGAEILEKKSRRAAKQGVIDSYIHFSQTMGALVEVNCETDFVAKTDDFKRFVKDLAMHIAAVAPCYISREEIPADIIEGRTEQEKEVFIKENCLLEQLFVKDNSLKISDYLNDVAGKFRENIVIKRFVRFSLGEE